MFTLVSKMADNLNSILQDLQNQLQTAKINTGNLSTIARQGDEKLVEQFMTENVFVRSKGSTEIKEQSNAVLASHFYVACFWGFRDIVKGMLEATQEQGIELNINHQNPKSLWTPLHAATFQEHGPIIMMLVDAGAQPELPDSEGRTAKDFASASDKVWGHFASLGLSRTSRGKLIQMGILQKLEGESRVQSAASSGRMSGRGIRMANYGGDSVASLLGAGGDVLANSDDTSNSRGHNPRLAVYK